MSQIIRGSRRFLCSLRHKLRAHTQRSPFPLPDAGHFSKRHRSRLSEPCHVITSRHVLYHPPHYLPIHYIIWHPHLSLCLCATWFVWPNLNTNWNHLVDLCVILQQADRRTHKSINTKRKENKGSVTEPKRHDTTRHESKRKRKRNQTTTTHLLKELANALM